MNKQNKNSVKITENSHAFYSAHDGMLENLKRLLSFRRDTSLRSDRSIVNFNEIPIDVGCKFLSVIRADVLLEDSLITGDFGTRQQGVEDNLIINSKLIVKIKLSEDDSNPMAYVFNYPMIYGVIDTFATTEHILQCSKKITFNKQLPSRLKHYRYVNLYHFLRFLSRHDLGSMSTYDKFLNNKKVNESEKVMFITYILESRFNGATFDNFLESYLAKNFDNEQLFERKAPKVSRGRPRAK